MTHIHCLSSYVPTGKEFALYQKACVVRPLKKNLKKCVFRLGKLHYVDHDAGTIPPHDLQWQNLGNSPIDRIRT